MSVRARLEKLEQRAQVRYETLQLPDGTEVLYTGEDALDAVVATMDQEDHWLLPYLRQMETSTGLPGLIRALQRGDVDGS
jgi:hypothetical protein